MELLDLPARFSVEEEIGSGGMAVVYRGRDHHLDRPVAIKVLRAEQSSGLEVARFQREIGLTANLVHPGIVAVFDSGAAGGRLYYVMPFVRGDTLRSRLHRDRMLAPADVATIGADVAEALAYAHGAGIVHRDIKPENIFLVEGRAVLADFGVASAAQHHGKDEQTVAGMIVGTATYMSPEQIEGADDVDGRSDLYSLGCVLYELLAGVPPFQAPGMLPLLAKHLTETPVRLGERRAGVPESLETIVMRLLAKDREDRCSSAAELAPMLRMEAAPATIAGAITAARTGTGPAVAPSSEIDRLLKEATDKLNQASAAGPAALRRLDEARALIDRAAAIDAEHPRVLSALGRWYNASGHRRGTGDTMVAEARRYLMRSLAADDRDPDVHQVLGKMALFFDDDFNVAEHHARRAVELAPEDPEGLRFLAIIEKILGRLEESIDAAQRAARSAPQLAAVWNGLGDALLAAGRNAEASKALERAIAIQPAYAPALERLELAQLQLGDVEFAVELRASRLRAGGAHERAEALERGVATGDARQARRTDLERELAELLTEANSTDPFAQYQSSRSLGDRIVHVYTQLDDWESALEWVERGFRARPGRLRRALMDQLFDRRGFARLPRYGRLLRLAGLESLL